ncbi:MAG: DMT family transporter [bacterium]
MDLHGIPYIGETFALLAPLSWSFAVILFRITGKSVSPIPLNFFKNFFAIFLFAATALLTGQGLIRDVPSSQIFLLIASGAIGIGISDTFFFMTLNRLGAGLQAIVNTSYSPSIIVLSVLFLGEVMTPLQLFGVALILGAVLAVTRMKGPSGNVDPRQRALGILFGVLAALTQAISIVMIKPMLGDAPIFWANTWRLLGGIAVMFLILPFLRGRRKMFAELRNRSVWSSMIPASLIGTYVSLVFWLSGMKYTQASTASALNQTSTLFTFLLAALLLREPVTAKRVLGVIIGMGGVLLVIFGEIV